MSDGIQFNEEPSILYTRVQRTVEVPRMVQLVADKWLSGDTNKARKVLLVTILCCIALTILIPIFFGADGINRDGKVPGFMQGMQSN